MIAEPDGPPTLQIEQGALDELLSASRELLISMRSRGALDEKGNRFHQATRNMVSVSALAEFDGAMPKPFPRSGGGES